MKAERLYHSIRLFLIKSPKKRALYLKKHNILGAIGEGCYWGPWLVPLYPKMIKLHDNVHVHRSARILTHDILNRFFKECYPDTDFGYKEKLGCVELMDNVYISMKTTINPNVRINKNCIVSAGSVVTSDVPENSIVSGIPAKVVGRFDMFMALRKMSKNQTYQFKNQKLPDSIAEEEWEKFYKKHEAKKENT